MELIKLYETTIQDAVILRVAAGTTGLSGGDGGHGGKTIIEIENVAGPIHFTVIRESPGAFPRGFALEMDGDAELRAITSAMEFIAKTLRREMGR